jgi:hypothetical protein
VPKEWRGETAVVLASGPSMTREQAEYVRGKCRVIAVNNQGIDTDCDGVRVPAFAPWADVLYAADTRWWLTYKDRAFNFAGTKVTIRDANGLPESVRLLQVSPSAPFDPRPTHLATGGNSGYQAVHLAVHYGATRIIMLGFDMKEGPNKRRHWFGNHPGVLNAIGNYGPWIRSFKQLAPVLKKMGIEALNCTPGSALDCFPKASLESVL